MARRVSKAWNPRTIIALVLAGFVLVATGVIARRTYGIGRATEIRELERQRDALETERVRLDAEIRAASSLEQLAPILQQRLHMHVPADSQTVILPRPVIRPQ
jgi:cell division protein FtsL